MIHNATIAQACDLILSPSLSREEGQPSAGIG